MNTRTPLIRAAVATALAGGVFLVSQVPQAIAAQASQTMSVEARAPLQATLLPVVSVVADATHPDGVTWMQIASTEALPVTLMPTVFVTARADSLAETMPSSVRAAVDTRLATADKATLSL
jgi:hypothetical protein